MDSALSLYQTSHNLMQQPPQRAHDAQRLSSYLPPDTFRKLLAELEAPSSHLVSCCTSHLHELLQATTSHLPKSLVEWVADNPTPGLADGRFISGTLLFADISGFTAMSEMLSRNGREGAEEITSVVNQYFDVMLEILKQFDGQLVRFGGDALLGLFEPYTDPPVEPINSATRAVMAAMQMQAAMVYFTNTKTSQGTFPLRMSVGVHSGRFFAAQLGNRHSMTYALFGKDVNETAAIEAVAQAGQVVLDRKTYEQVDPLLLCTATAVPDHPDYFIVKSGYLTNMMPTQEPFQTQIPDVPDMETVRRLAKLLDAYTPYLPIGLLPQLVVGSRSAERPGEHRLVASLFVNIEGLSDVADRLGEGHEQTIVDALNHYFLEMARAVARFGGVINKIDLSDHGEKLMVTFGAPVAHEDDTERAIRAAHAMMKALPAISQTVSQMTGLPRHALRQRIGISFGSVYAGFVGAAWRHEYTVMGDEVNLAARLMAQAQCGEVIVSEKVARRVQSVGTFEQRGLVSLKGKSRPLPIFVLTAVSQTTHRSRDRRDLRAPLVGRNEEVALLQQRLDSLLAGDGGATAIIGDAGVGKSRLLTEQLDSVPERLRTIQTRCLSYTETSSYSSMQELVRRLCGITPEQGAAESLGQLESALSLLLSTESAVTERPYLAHFLNLKPDAIQEAKIKLLDAEALRQRTYIALRAFFAAVSRRAPLAIVLDDMQWMDGASYDLLMYLLPLSRKRPLHWFFLFRPERHKACWQLHKTLAQEASMTYVAIQLGGLKTQEARRLLGNLLGLDKLPEKITASILNRSEGNPLYLEEVLRALINDGVLHQDENGRWHSQPNVTNLNVPDTLEGVLMARLDRAGETARRAAQAAAVIGRIFPLDVLQHTTYPLEPEQLIRHLTDLQRYEMIQQQQSTPEEVFGFIHSLLQEVAYGSQSLKARRRHHRRIAAYLDEERTGGWGDIESLVPLIAHHAYLGEDWVRALRYQIKTGALSMTLFANHEAIDHYLKALESAEKLPEAETAVQRLNIHLSLGQVYITTDQYDDAACHLDKALKLAEAMNDSGAVVAVCRWRTRLHELKGEYDTAFRWINRGLKNEVNTADVPQIMLLAGLIHIRQGRYDDALAYCRTVLELAEQQGEVTAVARANNLLGITFLRSDSLRAIGHFEQAYDLYRQAGDVQGEATSHNLIANACFNLGRWAEADHHYRRALAIFDQISDTYNRIMAVNNLGGIARNQGKLGEALDFYKEGLELAQQIGGSAWMVGVFEMNIGATHLRLMQPAAALNHLNASEAQFNQAGSRDFLPELLRHRAKAMLLANQPREAEQFVREAFELAQTQNNQSEMGCSQRVQGEILLEQAAASQAAVALENSVALLEAAGEEYELAKSRFWLAKAVWEARHDSKQVLSLLTQSQSVFHQLAATMDAAAVSQFEKEVRIEVDNK